MKFAKRLLSSLLATAMAVTAVSTFVFASDEDNLMIIEDFNTKSVGEFQTPVQIFERWGAQPTIAQRAEDNNWLKITSRGGDGFVVTEKGTESTAEAMVMYAKTNDKSVGFLLAATEESGAQFNMQVAGATVAYKLIDTEGIVTSVDKVDKVTVPANFEGWIVLTMSSIPYQHSGTKHDAIVPSDIRSLIPYVIDVPDGAELYLDDIGFAKSMDTFIADHKAADPPKTDDKPEGLNFYLGQGFGTLNVGDTDEAISAGGAVNITAAVSSVCSSVIADNGLGYGKSIKTTVSVDGAVNDYDIFTRFTEADRTALKTAGAVDSLVFRIKTPSYEPFKTQIMLMEAGGTEESPNYGAVSALYWTAISQDADPIYATFVDANTKQYTQIKLEAADSFLPSGFDGWVILPLDFFQKHPGYTDSNNQFDANLLSRVKINFIEAKADAVIELDNIGLAKATDLMTSLGAEAKPVDKNYTMEAGNISTVPAADFTYAKENNVNVNVNVEDGYLLYSWNFVGSEITNAEDFDPTISFDFDEIKTIEGLTKGLTARFFKTSALPGPATLKVHTDDVVTNPYLYKYDAATKKITLVSEDKFVVDNDSLCLIGLEEGGIYFLSDEKVVLADGTQPDVPNNSTPNEDKPGDTGVDGIGFAVVALLFVGGATVIVFSKKRSYTK